MKMDKVIWKYTLQITDEQWVQMPVGAEILTVQMQDNQLRLWARVSSRAVKSTRRKIAIYGTGNPASDGAYIGTVQLQGGGIVLHAFDVTDVP